MVRDAVERSTQCLLADERRHKSDSRAGDAVMNECGTKSQMHPDTWQHESRVRIYAYGLGLHVVSTEVTLNTSRLYSKTEACFRQ
jgi:hypothetical protein